MPASLAVAPAAVTVARSALLSNQFPPLYDAASGGHHLALTPRLVGFIRLVVILCAAIFGLQAGCEASFGQYRSTVPVAPDLRVEWGEVAGLFHAPGGASQSNRGHMRITSNSELRAQLTSYYDWVQ